MNNIRLRMYIKKIIKGTYIEPFAKSISRELRERRLPRINRWNKKYDRQTIEIMSQVLSPSSNCVDVGAHHGSILKEIIHVAPNGQHYAFEPIPECAIKLKENFPFVIIHDIALGNKTGNSNFYQRFNEPARSSLYKNPTYDNRNSLKKINIKIDKLDNIIQKDIKIDFTKIDVECAELDVLLGASNTIKENRPFIVFEHGWDREYDSDQIFDLLVNQCSMKISLLGDWLHGRNPLSRNKFIKEVKKNWYFFAYP